MKVYGRLQLLWVWRLRPWHIGISHGRLSLHLGPLWIGWRTNRRIDVAELTAALDEAFKDLPLGEEFEC